MMPVLRLTDSDTVTVATANRRAVVVLAQHVTRIKQERESSCGYTGRQDRDSCGYRHNKSYVHAANNEFSTRVHLSNSVFAPGPGKPLAVPSHVTRSRCRL